MTVTATGLLAVDRAVERHPVRPGGLTVLALEGDDEVEVVDVAGAQLAELTVLTPDGRADPVALDLRPDAPATVLRALAAPSGLLDVSRAASVAGPLLAGVHRPAEARAARLFGTASPRGASERFVAARPAVLVVAAPAPALLDGGVAGSELELRVRRATVRPVAEPVLPPPLAEPRLDLRVGAATALAYEVAAGEHIEIIDVAGRQCSDFLAFAASELQEGRELGLDAAATRTLTGRAFPAPGRHGRFFGHDLQPLCELVRDTVGRHDAFALACTARYYEDLGYPGHANCSSNFNAALEPYGVAPRAGWAALNFFYNTAFDADLRLTSDEPWSRPGDRVLLRASTDLICASSACPDDIDPSNGWEITDVHLRVYPAPRRFSVAMVHRSSPEEEPRLTRETAFHERTAARSRTLTEYQGFWLPETYDGHGALAEYWAVREGAGVMDLSPLRKWEVLGPDAETLLQRTVTRDVRRLAVGQVTYCALCNDDGGMRDDATLFRLEADNFRLVGGDERDGAWLVAQARRLGLDRVWIKATTDQLHNLAVQGPGSRALLAPLVWTPPSRPPVAELGWFRFTVGRLGGPQGLPLVVSRTGYTGELGFEVFCHPADALALWDAVAAAGATPVGLEALDVLRIEAGLVAAGREFDDEIDPFEAGIGFAVALGGEDFVGRDALLARRDHPRRTLVGLRLDGPEVVAHGDPVLADGRRIGVVTSATRSPSLGGASIALARVATSHQALGTEVLVGRLDGLQKRLRARVVGLPFHDPERRRVRSSPEAP